jgi:hypothetical protein
VIHGDPLMPFLGPVDLFDGGLKKPTAANWSGWIFARDPERHVLDVVAPTFFAQRLGDAAGSRGWTGTTK